MNPVVIQVNAGPAVSQAQRPASLLAERVRETARAFGCKRAWARAAGRHVILGMGEDEAFARVTPVGDRAFALSFRSRWTADAAAAGARDNASALAPGPRWEPLLLIDELTDVVEHALVGEGQRGQSA